MGAALALAANTVLAATPFYVDPNAAPGGNGSLAAPFRTIADVNAAQAGTRSPAIMDGDSVYFKCGSAWPAQNEMPTALQLKSGVNYNSYYSSSSFPIYGCASTTTPALKRPILRGSVKLTGLKWTLVDAATNMYSAPVSIGSRITQLVDPSIDPATNPSQRLQRARYPNIGEGNYDNAISSRYLKIGAQTPGYKFRDDLDEIEKAKYYNTTPYLMQLTAKSGKGIPFEVKSDNSLIGAQAYVHTVNWHIRRFKVVAYQASSDLVSLLPSDPREWKGEVIRGLDANNLPAPEIGGFWLEDQKWMLDAPGEWYHDQKNGNKLFVVCAPNKTPSATYYATVGNYGIVTGINPGNDSINGADSPNANKLTPANIANRFTLKNLEVQDTNLDGIAIMGNSGNIYQADNIDTTNLYNGAHWAINGFTIDGVTVTRAGRHGIVVRAANGVPASKELARRILITNNRIQYSMGMGLDLGSAHEWGATEEWPVNWMPGLKGADVTKNTLTDIGLDRFAEAAIRIGGREYGHDGIAMAAGYNNVSANVINRAGARGIDISGVNSTVRNNTITGSCFLLDDCGAIYTEASAGAYAMGLTVTNNTINTVGSIYAYDGLASYPMGSIGIYLDNTTSGVTVDSNTVAIADWGIDLHGTTNVTVSNNKVSQVSQSAITVGQIGTTLGNNVITGNTLSAKGQANARVVSLVANPTVTSTMVSLSNNTYSASNEKPFEINWGRLNLTEWMSKGLDSGSQLQ